MYTIGSLFSYISINVSVVTKVKNEDSYKLRASTESLSPGRCLEVDCQFNFSIPFAFERLRRLNLELKIE